MSGARKIKTEIRDGMVCTIMLKKNDKISARVNNVKDTFKTWDAAEEWINNIVQQNKAIWF